MTKKTFYTRYALTIGIKECGTRSERPECSPRCNEVKGLSRLAYLGQDLFDTREDAEAKAREMADRKIRALKKQIEKLEAIKVSPKWESKP